MENYSKTNWDNLFKIRIRELTEAQTKHLVIKALIVQKILIKHSHDRKRIRIYTEFPVIEGKVCDVYYENIKSKEAYAYEIQTNVTQEWIVNTKKIYKDWSVPYTKTSDWVLVETRKLSDDLNTLSKQVMDLVL